ncbi:MAG: hypothetical protein RL885_25700 [Planctomycetota bacterium]
MSKSSVLFCLPIVALLLAVPAAAQTNLHEYHNGVDYFFGNGTIPSNTTTYTRSFGSATSMGNFSGANENAVHGLGVQQDGFQAWNGQAGLTPSIVQPIGFSLMQFRRGGNFSQNTGTVVASAAWATSLPCNAPWFWIVTFTWGTTFTQTSTLSGASQNFAFSMRGETNQTVGNQNYWTGSGNERNINTGGLSFIEDTVANVAGQLIGAQEWSHSYFQVDAFQRTNRDPSGATSGSFGFDTASVGTGGLHTRSANSIMNPGAPADAQAIRHVAAQQAGTGNEVVLSLLAAQPFGGGLTADASGTFTLPAGDGRTTNLVADPILTNLGLSLSTVLTTGGSLAPLTGDVGVSGVAQTIPLDLSLVNVAPALQPLCVSVQSISISISLFPPSFCLVFSSFAFYID